MAMWCNCIAGFTGKVLKKRMPTWNEICTALQIAPSKAATLFHPNRWPIDLLIAYESAQTPQQRAEVAITRIDRFIEECESDAKC